MKKRIFILTIAFISCMLFTNEVHAQPWNSGGGTGNDIGTGGSASSQGSYSNYWAAGMQDCGAYRFDLVYAEKGTHKRDILKTVIVYTGQKNGYCGYNVSGQAKRYARKVGADYKTKGSLYGLARKLYKGHTIDELYGHNNTGQVGLTKAKEIVGFITDVDGFNVPEKLLTKEQDQNPGRYDSYGYRILIQRLTIFVTGGDVLSALNDSNSNASFTATRKDVAGSNSAIGVSNLSYNGLPVNLYPHLGGATDIYTTVPDIGISTGKASCVKQGGDSRVNLCADEYRDPYNGQGYNILWFSTDQFNNRDYSLDMACENCDSAISDNKSLIIQDATNWQDILRSKDAQLENTDANNYFYKEGYDVFCREEYWVYFPNKNNKINLQLGRYFTLNATQDDLLKTPDDIPNFRPVKVTKKRQCRKANPTSNLQKFKDDSDGTFANCTGKIKVYYKSGNYVYNESCNQELKRYKNYDKFTSQIDGNGQLNQEVTYSYTLPDNLYRYVDKGDGSSLEKKPADNRPVTDLKVSNFPLSYNEAGSTSADLRFTFELPDLTKCFNNTSDKYSNNMKAAYTKNNDYFKAKHHQPDNIYKKYSDPTKQLSEGDNINDTACVKLYGLNNAKKCIEARTDNKMGTRKNGVKNCYDKFEPGLKKCSDADYLCTLTDCDEDDAKKKNEWNEKTQTCCPPGVKYNKDTGQCGGKPKIICNKYTAGGGKFIDLVWDEVTQKCITKDSYQKCDLNCPVIDNIKACCQNPGGVSFCGTVIDGKIVCSGKPKIYDDVFAKNLIYRTIDISEPFTMKNEGTRQTGDNWCDSTANGLDCSTTNNTVSTVITNTNITEDNAMYRVTLGTKEINAIRKYNNDQKEKGGYDDFTLECSKQENNYGNDCVSKEFYTKTNLRLEGTCGGANHNVGSFNNCIKTK